MFGSAAIDCLILVFAFVLGVCLGSFLNVVVTRRPAGESMGGRSKCRSCGHQIRLRDNIPVISWLALGGKCRDCKAPISWRYPAIELTTGLIFVAIGAVLLAL